MSTCVLVPLVCTFIHFRSTNSKAELSRTDLLSQGLLKCLAEFQKKNMIVKQKPSQSTPARDIHGSVKASNPPRKRRKTDSNGTTDNRTLQSKLVVCPDHTDLHFTVFIHYN